MDRLIIIFYDNSISHQQYIKIKQHKSILINSA